jgi:hypothetical protein
MGALDGSITSKDEIRDDFKFLGGFPVKNGDTIRFSESSEKEIGN